MKTFKGKAIYNPSGKAGEYSTWACNFYTGCANDCDYCYCKRGVMSHVWSLTPKLKKCFKDEEHALYMFEKELKVNLSELQKHGLFFTFTSDPFLQETSPLTISAINICIRNYVPVKILTKRADWEKLWNKYCLCTKSEVIRFVAFGFTLTGRDDCEPNASPNAERINAMRKLHEAGFKTWASIEPIIDIDSSLKMIEATQCFCDLYKVGLMSGKKYDSGRLLDFIFYCMRFRMYFYFKDGFLEQAGITREELSSAYHNCVGRDYNIFNS
jgi:DNA repair photolyase